MRRTILLSMSLGLFSSFGCELPRADHRPIPGVEVPHAEGANPYDEPSGGPDAPLLDDFHKTLIAHLREAPGVVAVFPALSPGPAAGTHVTNGLGEYLAEETARTLEDAEVRVLTSSRLVSLIRGAGQKIRAYGSLSDAWVLAGVVKADYVVTGTARHRILDATKRDDALEIDWMCQKVDGEAIVARVRRKLEEGPLAETLMRTYRLQSEWEGMVRIESLEPEGTEASGDAPTAHSKIQN